MFNKERSYLGIDVGTDNIKLVELKDEAGRPKLVTYGFTDLSVRFGGDDLITNVERTAQILNRVCRKAKITGRKVVAALPVSSIFSSVINLTGIKTDSPKELEDTIKWEAKKVIPLPLEEMILDWKTLSSENEKVDGEIKVNRFLLTAAPQKLVQRYLELFKKTNLEIISLETEGFALVRSLVGGDKSAVMIVDVGGRMTNISVIKNSIPVLNRSIDTGGANFTQIISQGLKLDWDAAEQFKKDLSTIEQVSEFSSFQEVLNSLVHEIKYCFGLYQQENDALEEKIEKVILTGGSSLLPNFDVYLSKALNIKVFVGDPWARTIYPESLKPVLDKIGPKMAVAVGLAMREIE